MNSEILNTVSDESKINSAQELEVFKRSHELTSDIYKVTEDFLQVENTKNWH